MSDFEKHPIGTAKELERLRAALQMMSSEVGSIASEVEEHWYRDLATIALKGGDIEEFRVFVGKQYEYYKKPKRIDSLF